MRPSLRPADIRCAQESRFDAVSPSTTSSTRRQREARRRRRHPQREARQRRPQREARRRRRREDVGGVGSARHVGDIRSARHGNVVGARHGRGVRSARHGVVGGWTHVVVGGCHAGETSSGRDLLEIRSTPDQDRARCVRRVSKARLGTMCAPRAPDRIDRREPVRAGLVGRWRGRDPRPTPAPLASVTSVSRRRTPSTTAAFGKDVCAGRADPSES